MGGGRQGVFHALARAVVGWAHMISCGVEIDRASPRPSPRPAVAFAFAMPRRAVSASRQSESADLTFGSNGSMALARGEGVSPRSSEPDAIAISCRDAFALAFAFAFGFESAVALAAVGAACGLAEVVIVGGLESMSMPIASLEALALSAAMISWPRGSGLSVVGLFGSGTWWCCSCCCGCCCCCSYWCWCWRWCLESASWSNAGRFRRSIVRQSSEHLRSGREEGG